MTSETDLSAIVTATVEYLFPPAEQETVLSLLREECTTKLALASPSGYERIQLAVLKICAGKMDQFHESVKLAQLDWRDVLMWAEFGSDLEAHLKWAGKLCRRCEG